MKKIIWLYYDGKKGHEKQSEAFLESLSKKIEIKIYKIKALSVTKNLFYFFFKKFDKKKLLPKPDFLIGTGHKTHLNLLLDKKYYGGETVVIMKPSLPLNFFDLCFIPSHDLSKNYKNTIATFGPINNLSGVADKNKNKGLILLGGLSKHFEWSNNEVAEHISNIIFENKSIDITIFDSRRTPHNFFNILKRKLKKPIEIIRYKDKDSDLITKKMEHAKYIWVTEDSLSMIYESIAVGSEVTCINLKKKTNKLRNITNYLFEKKKINFFQRKNRKLNLNLSKQSVADECTKLFIKFFKIK